MSSPAVGYRGYADLADQQVEGIRLLSNFASVGVGYDQATESYIASNLMTQVESADRQLAESRDM